MLFKNQSKQSVAARLLLLIPVIMISFAFQSAERATPLSAETLTESVLKPVTGTQGLQQRSSGSQPADTTLFTSVEIAPMPVGGIEAFYKFVGKNFQYPKAAQEAQVEGMVLLQFIVEKDGSLTNINLLRDIGHGTGEEAIRMLKTAPKWKPGIQNGRTVRVQFTLPIQLNRAATDKTPEDKTNES